METTDVQADKEELAYSLADALLAYAPAEVRKDIGNRKETEEMNRLRHSPPLEAQSPKEIIWWAVDTFGAIALAKFKGMQSKLTIPILIQERLNDLYKGRLVAVGTRLNEHSRSVCEAIPRNLWPGTVNWPLCAMQSHGYTYTGIWVTRPENVDALLEALGPPQPASLGTGKPGRPTAESAIRQAYGEIQKDFSKSFTAHISAVQERAKEILGQADLKGLSASTISKKVGAEFNAEKQRQNPAAKL